MAAEARDSAWTVVPNAGKDAQGDEWLAFGSACGVVGMVEKGDANYAGLMVRCGGENGRIFCCMREGDVGEAEHFSVPLWGLGTPQGAMGGRQLVPGLALGSTCWSFEDGGSGITILRHRQSPGLGIYFLPKEGKMVYICPDGCDVALVISPRYVVSCFLHEVLSTDFACLFAIELAAAEMLEGNDTAEIPLTSLPTCSVYELAYAVGRSSAPKSWVWQKSLS